MRSFLLPCVVLAGCAAIWAPADALEAPATGELKTPEMLSDQLKASLEMVRASCVAVHAGGTASGVIISPDGLVLTAAHVARTAKKGQVFKVALEDGRKAEAELLGFNRETDFGLLRITSPSDEPWPHCPMAETSSVTGDFCFTMAHPSGLLKGRPAQVRIGRITSHSMDRDRPHYLIADCNIQPGDSGGPLFSMEGELIGLDSSAASILGFNIFPAIDQYHLDRERLLTGEKWGDEEKSPNGPAFTKVDLSAEALADLQAEFMRRIEVKYPPTMDFVETLANEKGEVKLDQQAIVNHMTQVAVAIAKKQPLSLGVDDPSLTLALEALPEDAVTGLPILIDDQRVGYAIAVDDDHVIAKASLLPDDADVSIRISGELVSAKRVATDEEWDLGLLQIADAESLSPVAWPESPIAVAAGDLLVVRDHADRLLWNVATDRARPVTKARSVGPLKDKSIISKHRAPYPEVIRHALTLEADDAGSPVFDDGGELVGIHIARFSRTMGLIIPVDRLEERVEVMLKQVEQD